MNEETNHSVGEVAGYVAGVKTGSVILYAQQASVPLLIDTNGDGVCDEINMKPDNATKPLQITLAPLTVRGSAFYPSDALTLGIADNKPNPACTAGSSMQGPDLLCPNSDMTRAISQTIQGAPPAIYGLSPSNDMGVACEGNSWELLALLGEGWACVAARVEDNIGNIGISRALRVCLDKNPAMPTHCDPVHDTPPTCMDGCTPPPDFPRDAVYKVQM